MSQFKFIPYQPYQPDAAPEVEAHQFYENMSNRRSVRFFSDKPVSREAIENLILAAGTAPSGANKQPWRFVAIQDPSLKREIRLGAEEEEQEFYTRRANPTWLEDLRPLATDDSKPFLEIAPWLVVVFKLMKDDNPETKSDQVYYVNESVGIACGIFITAAHHAGLATLTHTPPAKW